MTTPSGRSRASWSICRNIRPPSQARVPDTIRVRRPPRVRRWEIDCRGLETIMHLMTFSLMGSDEAREEIKNALFGSAYSRLLTECEEVSALLTDVARVRPSAAIVVLPPS